ncbi:hypothetical protein [Paenibacillus paeoniae]|uniref:DUF5590 domain-containing protein n=1 Tax=Paenibacillus paeoniae TaxID=2292705 RepID=A0A371PLW0_9BACL|nr:hypothetical protein [Paenibacillus paeoniae]REK77212.1 hypothetical protein DX130_09485 [Paenibacillus paeoniae]
MTPKRWLFGIIACIIAFGVWFGFYFREVQTPKWSEEAAMRDAVMATGEIAVLEKLYKHVWEATTWIAQGSTEEESELYVFLNDEGALLHRIKADEVLSEDQFRTKWLNEHSGASMIRVTPGLFREQPVWEVYYKEPEGNKERYKYQFYSFNLQATLIETYTLPTKTGP